MMSRVMVIGWCVVSLALNGSPQLLKAAETGRLVDLTHPFNAETIYWPTEKGFQFQQGTNGLSAKGYYYAANRFTTAEHGGTHLDAPRHFSAEGMTADQIPLERLTGEAAVIDVKRQCADNDSYRVTIDDLMAWEQAHGRQLRGMIVLLKTGWAARWGNRTAYLGTAQTGPAAVAELRFPGLSPLAAAWLAQERSIKAVGIDTASIDYGPSTHFETHVVLCTANIPIFENVASLEQLPAAGGFVTALPMKIDGGSGGPLRIIAELPHE